jgi:hypothetical protein
MPSLLIGLVAALASGAARAGDAACAWRVISPSARDEIVARYQKDGLAAANVYQLPTLDVQHVGDHCARAGASLGAAELALFLEARRDDLASQLRALGADPGDADDQWGHVLTPADRTIFLAYMEAMGVGRPPHPAEMAIVARLLDRPLVASTIQANGEDYKTKATLLAYYSVIARITAVEARF